MTDQHEATDSSAAVDELRPPDAQSSTIGGVRLDDVRPEVPLRDMATLQRVDAIARWGARQLRSSRGRRVIARRIVFALSRLVTPVVAVEMDNEKYLVGTRDRAIGAITFSEGGLDLALMQNALEILQDRTKHSLSGRTFVDIGANIGTATIPAVVRFGASNAVAVEPDESNLGLLRSNLILNQIEDKVITVNAALSAKVGVAMLELDGSNWGDHRIRMSGHSGPSTYDEEQRAVHEVRLTTFDSLVEDGTIDMASIGVVWIDTQGHEAQVLAGATTLLQSRAPVVTEYWPYGLRRASGLDQFHDLVESSFSSVVDLRATATAGRVVEVSTSEVARLAEIYTGTSYTDLLLLR